MESTAQYWKPFGEQWTDIASRCVRVGRVRAGCREHCIWRKPCPIAGSAGRKTDFRDAERLVKRHVSQELVLSFVPIPNSACGEHSRAQGINGRVSANAGMLYIHASA